MRINVEYSTQHWIFPIITIGILVILGALLIALEGRARIKAGKGFFVKPGRFFVEHYDKFKFWGTIALMVVYFFLLDKLGFTFWSIICLFLFNTLFANKAQLKNPRYHITSLIISVVACLIISVCSAPRSPSPCPPVSSPLRFRPWASFSTKERLV